MNEKKCKVTEEVQDLSEKQQTHASSNEKGSKRQRRAKTDIAQVRTTAELEDDDEIMQIEVDANKERREFPSEDELEEGEMLDEGPPQQDPVASLNNNATVKNVVAQDDLEGKMTSNAQIPARGKLGRARADKEGKAARDNPYLERSFDLLKNFRIKKGLMNEEELSEFMEEGGIERDPINDSEMEKAKKKQSSRG